MSDIKNTAVVLMLAVVLGCGVRESAEQNSAGEPQVARTKLERGPVTVTVEVAPQPARLSDEPTLTLTVEHDQGVYVELPPFGESMRDFIIRDFQEPLPEVRDQREILRQIYTLEPTTSGALQIDPITVTFTDHRPSGDGQPHRIETEALTLNVLSVVDAEVPSLADLEGFAAPVDLPPSRSWIGWSMAAALMLLSASVAGAWLIARRRRRASEPPLTPRELASRELQDLWRDTATRQDVKVFYVRLTAIVRNYIERTTGVHAPEQTTEEFLREIGAGTRFSRDERQRLKEFLESADLVKFARFLPQSSDVQLAYDRACRFVGVDEREPAA